MQKRIILILGANGVGKSTVARALLSRMDRCALVEAEACRAIKPFVLSEATRQLVIDNFVSLIGNSLRCSQIDTVLFPYGFHGARQQMWLEALDKLEREGLTPQVIPMVLSCTMEENIRRAQLDGRDQARIARGIAKTYHYYDKMDYPVIDITCLTPMQAAEAVLNLVGPTGAG
nr:hypothetical protein [bacterium]